MASARLSYDVAVLGGGAAGLAAAVSAASQGARTLLIEKYGFLGGMATAGMVGTICGLYHNAIEGPPQPLNAGLPELVARRLASLPGCQQPVRHGRVFVLPYVPFAFACLADQLTAEQPSLDVWLHSYLVSARVEAGSVEAVEIADWDRRREVSARAFVDATGDAVLSGLADVALDAAPPAARQLPSLVFVMQGVDPDQLAGGRTVSVLRNVAQAEAEGRLPPGSSNLALRLTGQPGEAIGKLALDGLPSGTTDGMTIAEREGRRRVAVVARFLVENIPAFRNSFLSHTAPQVGVREGRRILGRYRLTREDVLLGRSFEDGLVRAAWPIELWEPSKTGASFEYLEDGASYQIPLRALRPPGLDNIFVAGRCLSASHQAAGSARVIGTCLAVGDAVGRIAAECAGGRTP